MKVSILNFEDLTHEQQKQSSNNGSGKEYATYIKIEDVDGIRIYSDGMEPEDCTFDRDLKWIVTELNKAAEINNNKQRAIIS